MTKWLVINSTGPAAEGVVVNSTVVENLCVNTPYSPLSFSPYPPSILQSDVTALMYVETDQAHGTLVQWTDDPNVDNMPGAGEPLLTVTYVSGPGVILRGGGAGHTPRYRAVGYPKLYLAGIDSTVAEFVSFRTIEMVHDATEIERIGLSVRKINRILAPWVQENPLYLHATDTSDAGWTNEVEQVVNVGFEMMIYSFGTPFTPETVNDTIIAGFAKQIGYANSKGIEVGGYDLIILQRGYGGYGGDVGPAYDVVEPDGSGLGPDACMASGWRDNLTFYFGNFHNKTGLVGWETDGPYGGDACAAENHTYHINLGDSVYHANKLQADFYAWLRTNNAFINQPDNYFLAGAAARTRSLAKRAHLDRASISQAATRLATATTRTSTRCHACKTCR